MTTFTCYTMILLSIFQNAQASNPASQRLRRRLQSDQDRLAAYVDVVEAFEEALIMPDSGNPSPGKIPTGTKLTEDQFTDFTTYWDDYNDLARTGKSGATGSGFYTKIEEMFQTENDFDNAFLGADERVDIAFKDALNDITRPDTLDDMTLNFQETGPGTEVFLIDRSTDGYTRIQELYEESLAILTTDQFKTIWGDGSTVDANGVPTKRVWGDFVTDLNGQFKTALHASWRDPQNALNSLKKPIFGGATATTDAGDTFTRVTEDAVNGQLDDWRDEVLNWQKKFYLADKSMEEFADRGMSDEEVYNVENMPLTDELVYVVRGPMREDKYLFQEDFVEGLRSAKAANNDSELDLFERIFHDTDAKNNYQNALYFSPSEMNSIRFASDRNTLQNQPNFGQFNDSVIEAMDFVAEEPFQYTDPDEVVPDDVVDSETVREVFVEIQGEQQILVPSLFWVYFAIAMVISTIACVLIECFAVQPKPVYKLRTFQADPENPGAVTEVTE